MGMSNIFHVAKYQSCYFRYPIAICSLFKDSDGRLERKGKPVMGKSTEKLDNRSEDKSDDETIKQALLYFKIANATNPN